MALSITSSRLRINSKPGLSVRKTRGDWTSAGALRECCTALHRLEQPYELMANATVSCVCNETIKRLTSAHVFLYVELEIPASCMLRCSTPTSASPPEAERGKGRGKLYVDNVLISAGLPGNLSHELITLGLTFF